MSRPLLNVSRAASPLSSGSPLTSDVQVPRTRIPLNYNDRPGRASLLVGLCGWGGRWWIDGSGKWLRNGGMEDAGRCDWQRVKAREERIGPQIEDRWTRIRNANCSHWRGMWLKGGRVAEVCRNHGQGHALNRSWRICNPVRQRPKIPRILRSTLGRVICRRR